VAHIIHTTKLPDLTAKLPFPLPIKKQTALPFFNTHSFFSLIIIMVVVIQEQQEDSVEFHDLPEGCIENVLSFTTPRDVARLSLVSSTFRSAAESDSVWDKFLPFDYRSIISQCDEEIDNSLSVLSKKDLYLYLTQKPILIDDGKKVISFRFFWLIIIVFIIVNCVLILCYVV
jgi:hypothetical protein